NSWGSGERSEKSPDNSAVVSRRADALRVRNLWPSIAPATCIRQMRPSSEFRSLLRKESSLRFGAVKVSSRVDSGLPFEQRGQTDHGRTYRYLRGPEGPSVGECDQ